jgi:hypothetical protein
MIPTIIYLLAALAFLNQGFLPDVENRSVFLTQVARSSLSEPKEREAGTLHALLQHVHSDQARAEAFVSWLSEAASRYVSKIRKEEHLPLMITYDLVLEFFFDMHLYNTKTQEEWNDIIQLFDMSILSQEDQKIFQTILIPYLQEKPSVKRAHHALKSLYHARLSDPKIKERVKAFFVRIGLPLFAWRLEQHVKTMNNNPYLVARAEQTLEYIIKRYQKEETRLAVG